MNLPFRPKQDVFVLPQFEMIQDQKFVWFPTLWRLKSPKDEGGGGGLRGGGGRGGSGEGGGLIKSR